MTNNPTPAVEAALRRAFSLGQTYWQQADSDSYKQNAKSHETAGKFDVLVEETRALLRQPEAAPGVADIEERERMRLAGISTAAQGYWKEGDSIHSDYDTVALRDVAKLYAKYDALYQQINRSTPAPSGDEAVVRDGVLGEVLAEVERAIRKFPTWPTDPLHALAVLGEAAMRIASKWRHARWCVVLDPEETSTECTCGLDDYLAGRVSQSVRATFETWWESERLNPGINYSAAFEAGYRAALRGEKK